MSHESKVERRKVFCIYVLKTSVKKKTFVWHGKRLIFASYNVLTVVGKQFSQGWVIFQGIQTCGHPRQCC